MPNPETNRDTESFLDRYTRLRSEYRQTLADTLKSIHSCNDESDFQAVEESIKALSDWLQTNIGNGKPLDKKSEQKTVSLFHPTASCDRTVASIRNFALNKVHRIMDAGSRTSELNYLASLGIPVEPINGVIFPPGEAPETNKPTTSDREPVIVRFEPRLQKFITMLNLNGISNDEINVYPSALMSSQGRRRTYYLIKIPKIERSVVICNQVGQATYVVIGDVPDEELIANDKVTLRKKYPDRLIKIKYRSWEEDLTEALFGDYKKLGIERKALDQRYFSNLENIKADLSAFAKEADVEIAKLTTVSEHRTADIICTNGQKIKLSTYLSKASAALSTDEEKLTLSETLITLKQLIGLDFRVYPKMDVEYFSDPSRVDADLTSFAMECGVSVADLTLGMGRDKKTATCDNGETITLHNYLYRAAAAYRLAKTAKQSTQKIRQALIIIKKFIGIEFMTAMDEKYFSSLNTIKNDLHAFSQKAGKPIKKISTEDLLTNRAICSNGELVRGRLYLCRAMVMLGYAKHHDEVNANQRYYWDILRELIGIKNPKVRELDEEYFRDPARIDADLSAFSLECGTAPSELLVKQETRYKEINCANGGDYKFHTYLVHASTALDQAANNREGASQVRNTLKLLKKMAGIEQKREMNKHRPTDELSV